MTNSDSFMMEIWCHSGHFNVLPVSFMSCREGYGDFHCHTRFYSITFLSILDLWPKCCGLNYTGRVWQSLTGFPPYLENLENVEFCHLLFQVWKMLEFCSKSSKTGINQCFKSHFSRCHLQKHSCTTSSAYYQHKHSYSKPYLHGILLVLPGKNLENTWNVTDIRKFVFTNSNLVLFPAFWKWI